MRYIADAGIAKDIDNISINTLGVPSVVLMERAADATADAISRENSGNIRVAAICGKGNNGGDAIACARILQNKGYDTDIYMLCDSSSLTYEAGIQYNIALKCGINIYKIDNEEELQCISYGIIIDGIFGVGLSKKVEGIYGRIIDKINNADSKVYSIDVPSGVNASDGAVLGIAVKADVTVTYGLNKAGLILYPGCEYAGRVIVADGVFPIKAYDRISHGIYIYEKDDVKKMPIRKPVSDKGSYGHVLVIAGSKGMSGAAYLSAKAAYRTGCGLVKIITHEDNRVILQSQLPEAIISTYERIDDINSECFTDSLLWADSIVAGPGMGISDITESIVRKILEIKDIPVIIDADAINTIAALGLYQKDTAIFDNAILTPHLKEMSRLTGNTLSASFIHDNIIDTARQYTYSNEVLVLKDARTIVCYRNNTYINTSGNNGMAVAGSGDVLTGIIASLAAQGLDRQTAAELGVYIHGLAGDYAAGSYNRYYMTSVDIIEALCKVN